MSLQCLVLAGGRGMRLDALTSRWPAPLLYLPGGTLLDYVLHHVSLLPVARPWVLLQYKGDAIASHLNERYAEPLDLIAQLPPFTMFGALASAVPHIEGATLVLHANHYFSESLAEALEEVDHERPIFFVTDGNDDLQQSGAYVLPPEAFYLAAQSLADGTPATLYHMLEEAGMHPRRHAVSGRAFAVQSVSDMMNLNRYLLLNWHDVLWPSVAGVGYRALTYSWISPSATLAGTNTVSFSTIGPHVTLRDSMVTNALVYPGVHLNKERERCTIMLVDGNDRLLQLYGNPAKIDAPDCR